MKPNFDVVLISKNEERTLPRLLHSLEEFRDRGGSVCLCDTGSTDSTVQVAKDWGCKVTEVGERFITTIDVELARMINERFVVEGEEPIVKGGDRAFNFADARNFAASLATNKLVWMPDSDEEFSRLDLDEVQRVFAQADRLEYEFIYAHSPDGKPSIRFKHSKAYNREKFSWRGRTHEVLSGDGVTAYLPQDRVLLEHWQQPAEHRSSYLTGLALSAYFNDPVAESPDRAAHYFFRELFYKGRYKSAIRGLEAHIAMKCWPAEASQSAIYIGDCYKELGQPDKAVESYHRAIAIECGRREPFIRLAQHYLGQDDFQRAACYAMAALQIPQGNFYANNMDHYRHVPHEILYRALWWLGRKEESKVHFDQAFAFQPLNPMYVHDRRFYYKNDEANVLTKWVEMLKEGKPFTFVKFGDGEMISMLGVGEQNGGQNCDGSHYFLELGQKLQRAYFQLLDRKDTWLGSFVSLRDHEHPAKATMLKDYEERLGWMENFKHVSAHIILNREPLTQELKDFYTTVAQSPRKKVYVGPKPLKFLATLLNTEFVEVPEKDAFLTYEDTLAKIKATGAEIVLSSAGMMSKILAADLDTTFIDVGSGLDSLLERNTRTNQLGLDALYPFYKELFDRALPTVAVVLPQLGREEGLKRGLDSIAALNYPQDKITIKVLEGEGTVPEKVKRGVEETLSHYVVYAANDMYFEPNSLLLAVVASLREDKALVSFYEGPLTPNDGNICSHFIIRRDFIPQLERGEVFSTDFHHICCDNFLWEQAKKLGQAYYCESAKITHKHFYNGGASFDSVYEKGWSKKEQDREVLKQKLANLYGGRQGTV